MSSAQVGAEHSIPSTPSPATESSSHKMPPSSSGSHPSSRILVFSLGASITHVDGIITGTKLEEKSHSPEVALFAHLRDNWNLVPHDDSSSLSRYIPGDTEPLFLGKLRAELNVVNDCTERGVKLMSDFVAAARSEQHLQNAQAQAGHRPGPGL
ncbi:hypothetical protein AAFF_G00209810 [Aldrovandia affinis]|uniref:Uncharacterized protein n=1 Tax=Aldrovandia affinis TaxID=143900 RepID=A0AAD7SWF8_9TELE|nr:hypothetical protein AAFF_G00209810 [Aldrovandia affinis]